MQVMKPVMPIKAYVKRDISTEQKGPEAPEPDPFADPAPGTFPCDLAAYLVELACLVYSPPPEVLKVLKGFDLRLMSSLFHVSSIPTEGKALIIVAEVNNVLYFRIIDGDGKVVVDTNEQRLMGQPMRNLRQLTGQARQIEDLRKQLESLWPPHELTWSDKDQVTKAVTSIVGHTLVKGRMCTDVQFFDRCDIQAVGFVHRGHKILVFRGTDSAPDWKYNLKICKSGSPRRHSGFKQAWEAVAPEITTWIASIPSPGPLILSGHSLGGALAILAAFELSARTPIKAIITFGAPRVGGRQFRHAYHQRAAVPHATNGPTLESITWRVEHSTDLVVDLAPVCWPFYLPVGQVIHLSAKGFLAPMVFELQTQLQAEGESRHTIAAAFSQYEVTVSAFFERITRLFTLPSFLKQTYVTTRGGTSFEHGSSIEPYVEWLAQMAFCTFASSTFWVWAVPYALIQLVRGTWTDISRHSRERYMNCLLSLVPTNARPGGHVRP